MKTDPRKALILAPATRWGSWAWLERVIDASPPDVSWIVVAYGRPARRMDRVRFVTLPAVDYARLGLKMSQRWLWPLNLVFYLPLLPIAWFQAVRHRPATLIGNGLAPTVALSPLRALGFRLVLAYHGYVGPAPAPVLGLLKSMLAACQAAFVNSRTSLDDLSRLLPRNRILMVEHWADDVFFQTSLEKPARTPPVVLCVGRLYAEKFGQCVRVCTDLAKRGYIEFVAVGEGPLAAEIAATPNCRHHTYIEDRRELAALYEEAAVVWAPADVTYLSIPGVEALAAGCPVIVTDIPAVEIKAQRGVRIPRDLVPAGIGLVVDGDDDREAESAVETLVTAAQDEAVRRACREHASRHHSSANLRRLVTAMLRL
ncbi:MAG: glycosyltransferase [Actinomycetota bacterium]